MSTQSYDLGWNDCRKREVQPLTEENARLRAVNRDLLATLNAILAVSDSSVIDNIAQSAIAEAQKATGGQP